MGIKVPTERTSAALARLLRPWATSLRFTVTGGQVFHAAIDSGTPVIVALWHEELIPLTCYGLKQHLNLAAVVSQSRDGELIARVLEKCGFATARGSSSRGGVRALVSARRLLKQGRVMTITVDGPRGPRQVAKPGAIHLLSATPGAVLIPARASIAWRYRFQKSWDKFQIPVPFSKVRIAFGKPLSARDLTPEELTMQLKKPSFGD